MRSSILRVIDNPPNPWIDARVDWVGEPPKAALEVFEDSSRRIIAKNDSPDISFNFSVNPYRGCYHGCAYCYARPTHQYLDLGAGTDFDRKITVKKRAPELLREAFMARGWRGELIAFSGNTDCYQPLEASMHLTRRCLEVCLEFRNPVGIITKSTLIERDVDLIAALSRKTHCRVMVSVPFFDPDHARAIEPYVPTPQRRIDTIRVLANAGIDVGVMVAPIIPGLSDADIPQILEAARQAGARYAAPILIRLPGPVREVFERRLRAALPMRAERVLNQIAECRDGKMNVAQFGDRMRGTGARWAAIEQLFKASADRLGYVRPPDPPPTTFKRPTAQLSLF